MEQQKQRKSDFMQKQRQSDLQRARIQSRAAVERVRRQSVLVGDDNAKKSMGIVYGSIPATSLADGQGLAFENIANNPLLNKRAKHPKFKSQLHEIMYQFSESRTFGIFILLVILINTVILIALTWQTVSVRFGRYIFNGNNIVATLFSVTK